jgi:hypothetical protein
MIVLQGTGLAALATTAALLSFGVPQARAETPGVLDFSAQQRACKEICRERTTDRQALNQCARKCYHDRKKQKRER